MPTESNVIELVINRARKTRRSSLAAAERRSEPGPTCLLLSQHETWRDELLDPTGDPVRVWTSDDDFAQELSGSQAPKIVSYSDCKLTIATTTIVKFFIHKNGREVLICEYIGPRYGTGGWYNVETADDQIRLSLNPERKRWIS